MYKRQDLNNDDVDDIFTVTVEKDYSDYENTKTYDTIQLHYASYIARNGSFKKNSDISRKLFITYLRLLKHSEIEYHFAIVPDTNGKSIIIRSSEFKDDSEIYGILKGETVVSPFLHLAYILIFCKDGPICLKTQRTRSDGEGQNEDGSQTRCRPFFLRCAGEPAGFSSLKLFAPTAAPAINPLK